MRPPSDAQTDEQFHERIREEIHDAVRRADAARLSALLDARDCPPALLGRLIRHEDPGLCELGLVLLTERVTPDGPSDGAEGAELAGLLPGTPTGRPEADLLLAGLHERLAPYLRGRPRPAWRTAGLPARVRIAWLCADILDEPRLIREETRGELLYQAVRALDIARAPRPARLVDELAGSGDPVLRAEALRLARQGLRAGLLAPARVRTTLTALIATDDAPAAPSAHTAPSPADTARVPVTDTAPAPADGPPFLDGGAPVVADALRELGEPWAATEPLPPGHLSPFLTGASARTGPGRLDAALTAAARHGHGALLRRAVADPGLPPGARRRAMELLGGRADRDDIGDLLAVAAEDPLLLGRPALACLRGLHRRGHFVADPHARAVVGLALADHSIPPDEAATILFTCRAETFRSLTDADPADPGWPRRLALLVALAGQGADELPVGEAITRVLPSAPDPGPFLRAIRELRHRRAEEAVIALLPSAPAAALDTLEAIGGRRTVRALRDGLGLTGAPPATHLYAVRHRALELLWQLTRDPEQRQALLVRLDPLDLPARVAADLGGPDERELALLRSRPDPDGPVAALRRTAAYGGVGTLPAVADLLLRIVSDLAAGRLTAPVTGPHDRVRPGAEPVVPQEVLDAVHALGRRLYERGAIRPVCLLDAADAPEAGHALVATTALDLLERPGLGDHERTILLELLGRAPWSGTRARVHRLLRHRDRHVRKQVIALLARDTGGVDAPGGRGTPSGADTSADGDTADAEDARALSATLIALTRAPDIQTVRQALRALGRARAHWASEAIAACLDHPNMNIRKTAAEALARAGTPAAVPRLLHGLGDHDNPGLRDALVEALRNVLGDAYAATLLAAAEHSGDTRSRDRLLEALHGTLTARSVLALDDQGSPVAASLLALVAAGRVGLASGTVPDLAAAMARHGVAAPDEVRRPPTDDGTDHDITTLVTGGWDPAVALRLAGRADRPRPERAAQLRPMLGDLLRLASARPAARKDVVRLALRACPGPRTADELTAYARSVPVLLDTLTEARDEDRHDLIAVLEEVAAELPAAARPAVVASVRALRPAPAAPHRSTLTLLRRLDAVLVRADLDRALDAARLGADPWKAVTAVLREAFAVPEAGSARSDGGRAEDGPAGPSPAPGSSRPGRSPVRGTAVGAAPPAGLGTDGTRAVGVEADRARTWRAALHGATRTPAALEEFRRRDDGWLGSRDRLAALIEAHHGADPGIRAALLDWMTLLQPLDAPPWTIAETARTQPPAPRRVRGDDLDGPRSTPLRARLLAMLESASADHRATAARALVTWPEPDTRRAVLLAFLRGRVDLPVDNGLARVLTALDPAELRGDGILRDRVALVAAKLGPGEREPLVPLLLEWWEQAPPALRPALVGALRAHPADALARALEDRLDAGARGFLDLLVGRRLLRTPALTRVHERLRAEGCDALADRLVLVEGPLRDPDAGRRDAAARAELRARTPAAPAGAPRRASRRELLELARTGTPDRACRALTELADAHPGPEPDRDPELRELLDELLLRSRGRVRLRAHRASRVMLDRDTHLRHTELLLDDPRSDVVRSAVRTLCRTRWRPAIPALTALLTHPRPAVREAAADGLAGMGEAAVPALRHAADHARPDRRARYTSVLDRITAARPAGRRPGPSGD
ncbi:HEAT repeat domain-containing protein [Streptomyces sp. NPDC006971]|uniref:HEAT repeat domain-containing protein n=1 Tax=Streptomyces sp. NPDC006971 TaxID=3154784 RepID=UPI003410F85B